MLATNNSESTYSPSIEKAFDILKTYLCYNILIYEINYVLLP